MKKILSIIIVVLLFVISAFIFWAGLSPQTYLKFFAKFPEVSDLTNKIFMNKYPEDLSDSLSSEIILGKTGQINIHGNTWSVEIVNNDKDREQGLSNRKALYNNKGMLFVFTDMKKQVFWMKDMLIPIDIIFFDNNWKIVLIESNLQPKSFPNTFGADISSQYVLEINAGEATIYDLKVGDQAIFLNK
jgi:uncharacterized protein